MSEIKHEKKQKPPKPGSKKFQQQNKDIIEKSKQALLLKPKAYIEKKVAILIFTNVIWRNHKASSLKYYLDGVHTYYEGGSLKGVGLFYARSAQRC